MIIEQGAVILLDGVGVFMTERQPSVNNGWSELGLAFLPWAQVFLRHYLLATTIS